MDSGINIYIGKLKPGITEPQIKTLFAAYGTVESVKVMVDKFTQQSRGFGFVKMTSRDQGLRAIEGLNGHDGMIVNEARPAEDRPRPRFGSNTGGGYGNDRGGQGGPRRFGSNTGGNRTGGGRSSW